VWNEQSTDHEQQGMIRYQKLRIEALQSELQESIKKISEQEEEIKNITKSNKKNQEIIKKFNQLGQNTNTQLDKAKKSTEDAIVSSEIL